MLTIREAPDQIQLNSVIWKNFTLNMKSFVWKDINLQRTGSIQNVAMNYTAGYNWVPFCFSLYLFTVWKSLRTELAINKYFLLCTIGCTDRCQWFTLPWRNLENLMILRQVPKRFYSYPISLYYLAIIRYFSCNYDLDIIMRLGIHNFYSLSLLWMQWASVTCRFWAALITLLATWGQRNNVQIRRWNVNIK